MKDSSISPQNLLEKLDDLLPLVRRGRLGLVVDFDGTISEIAPTPDGAEINRGCAEALGRLSRRLVLVAVVSGRSAADLSQKVGLERVHYVGNHGAEYLAAGQLTIAPGAAEYRGKVRAVLDRLRATVDLPGLIWQDKGLSASVHYRLSSDPDDAGRTLATALESASIGELEVFWGKRVLELRSPTGLNKGYALRKLAQDHRLDGAIFIGDDTTDVDALRALAEMSAQGGLRGVGVAVVHDDSPPELLDAADYALSGVRQVETFLRWLDTAVGDAVGEEGSP